MEFVFVLYALLSAQVMQQVGEFDTYDACMNGAKVHASQPFGYYERGKTGQRPKIKDGRIYDYLCIAEFE